MKSHLPSRKKFTLLLVSLVFLSGLHAQVYNATQMTMHATLQGAINAAAPSEIIELQANISEGLITINKSLTINGGGFTLTSTSLTWGMVADVPGITIQNITVQNAGTFGIISECGSDNLTITNTTVTNCGGTGFAINGVDNVTMTDITSTNNDGNGVSFTDCNNVMVTDLTTSGNTFGSFSAGVGIFSGGSCSPPAGTTNITFNNPITISEPVAVYEQVLGGGGTISGIVLPSSLTHFAGIGNGTVTVQKYYMPDLASAFTTAASLIAAPSNVPVSLVHVQEISTGNQYVDDNIAPAPPQVGTYTLSIQAAITYMAPSKTVFVGAGSFAEKVIVNKQLTLTGASMPTTVFDGTGLGNGNGITINNGITNVTIQDLTVRDYTGANGNSNAGIYAIGGNNNLTVQDVEIADNVGGSGFYANGPIDNVLLDNVISHGHTVGARGIVIWNGLKSNITITNCTVYNNNCCGIELQDGTASGVIMTGNNVYDNGDNGIGLVGLQGPGVNLIQSNTLLNNGRFGIEIKNPDGSGANSGAGSIVVDQNSVTRTVPIGDLRDISGIAVFRRGVLAGNVEVPEGVYVSNNTVTGYTQPSNSEGFGIVIEGINHTVTGNTVSGNDVGLQQQAGHTPLPPADGDQDNLADSYFGRGNAQSTCGNNISGNNISGNTVNSRDVGVGGGLVTNMSTMATYCTIQSAIDAASPGHIISIPAGTFAENLLVNKSLEIYGTGASTVIMPSFSGPTACMGPSDCVGASNVIKLGADNIHLHDFAINGNNPNLTSGVVVGGEDIDARNGIIADGVSPRSNIEINNITMSNIYYRGIYPQYTTNMNVHHNTVTNVRGQAAGSIAIFSWVSSGTVSNNTVSFASDAISANHSRGITFSNNTVTNSSSGVHTDNNGDSGGVADVITGNTVSDGGTNSYGIFVFAPYRDVVVSNNTLTNLDVGLASTGAYQAGVITTFTGNVVDGAMRPASTGMWATTNIWGYAPGNNNVLLENNVVTNVTDDAFYLSTDAGFTLDFQANNNSFTNNGNGINADGAGTLIQDLTCNWWGSGTYAGIVAEVGEGMNFIPALNNGTDNEMMTPGFQPVPMSCVNLGPVYNMTQNVYFPTIQSAINDPITMNGDVIQVIAGTYTENITINKALTINGPNVGVSGVGIRGAEGILSDCNIDITAAGSVILDGFHIYQTDNNADVVLISGGTAATIQNNLIEREGVVAGQIVRAITTSAGSGLKIIQGNRFTGNTTGGLFGGHLTWQSAMYINGAGSTIQILNNTFENSRSALNLDDYQAGITVSGNNFLNCGSYLSFGGVVPTNGQYVLGANNFGTPVSTFINLSNVNTAFRLDMTSSTINGVAFNTLTLPQLFGIESTMHHRGRAGKNGLVTYVSGNQYVVAGLTTIQSAVDYATAGDVINVNSGTYPEEVTVDLPVTIDGGTNVCADVIIDGGSVRLFGVRVLAGVQNVTLRDFKVQSTVGTAGIWAATNNNGLNLQNLCLENTAGTGAILAQGPVNGITINGCEVWGSGVNGRGIVVWDGFKQNITITNNKVHDIGGCCGIELQDGNASGVVMSGNTVTNTGDSGMSAVGLNGSTGSNTIANNVITNTGRFGLEIKNPNGNGSNIQVTGNTVSITGSFSSLKPSEERDIAGIAVIRRGLTAGNTDVPTGVTITGNIVSGYIQDVAASVSDGFGIVIEGTNHTVTNNNVSNNDVGIQQQAGHLPYPGDGDQDDLNDDYFGRGNSPMTCSNNVSMNMFSSNGIDTRNVGVGGGTVTVGMQSFCSIQDAIDAATTGQTINVGPGTYFENLIVDEEVTITGAGSGSDPLTNTVLQPLSNCGGTGITISASNVTVQNMYVTGFQDAIVLNGVDNPAVLDMSLIDYCRYGLTVAGNNSNIDIIGTEIQRTSPLAGTVGIRVGTANGINGLLIDNSTITGNALQGIVVFQSGVPSAFDNITIQNSTISNNLQKGVYFEKLRNALLSNLTMENNGTDPAYGFNNGIDINLKFDDYSNITIQNSLITNSGHTGTAGDPQNPAAIAIKARDDGGTYGPNPATLTGVTIKNNIIKGPQNAIRFGEFGTTNATPTNVVVEGNDLSGPYAYKTIVSRINGDIDLICNWHGTTDLATIQNSIVESGSGDVYLASILSSGGDDVMTIGFQPTGSCTCPIYNTNSMETFCTIQDAINDPDTDPGDVITVAPGSYVVDGQVVITEDITIQGTGTGCGDVTFVPSANTGSSGDARGWWLVNEGVEFNLEKVTLDGSGFLIWQAVRHKGNGDFDQVCFENILYQESGPAYSGTAVAAFGTAAGSNVDVTNSTFSNIGRVGVQYFGTGVTGSLFNNNTYTGKGAGNWLDYALDISAGAVVSASNNTVSGNLGVALSDNSTSAGILVSTFFGPGTTANILQNNLTGNTIAIAAGFNNTDLSTIVANNNNLSNNPDGGIINSNPSNVVDGTLNYWGHASGPSGVGSGSGVPVSAGVKFCPWLDAPMGMPVSFVAGMTITENSGSTNNDGEICAGDQATLTATGGPAGATYLWSPGNQTTSSIIVSATGNYTVTISYGGCTDDASASIMVNPVPVYTVEFNNVVVANGGSAAPVCIGDMVAIEVNGTMGDTYTISHGMSVVHSGTVNDAGYTYAAFINNSGVYTVEVTTPEGCTMISTHSIMVNVCPGPSELEWVADNSNSCGQQTNCCSDVICFTLEYTPGVTGVMTDYTTGFFVNCLGGNPIVYNESCVMNDNSMQNPQCPTYVFFNSSGNGGSVNVTEGVTISIHKVCFSMEPGDAVTITEEPITNLTASIELTGGGLFTEEPLYDPANFSRPALSLPANEVATVNCPTQATAPTPPTLTDYCGTNIVPTLVVTNTPDPLTCEGTRVYTYTYDDCSGNILFWTKTYTIDYVDFVIADPAGGSTVDCPDDTDIVPTAPVVNDNCGNLITPTWVRDPKPMCEGFRIYTFTYTDCSGFTHNWVYAYYVQYEDFVITSMLPTGSIVDCPMDTEVEPAHPVVVDNCGVEIMPTGPVKSSLPGCEGTRTYTWTYTDCDGNTHPWVYTYTVEYEPIPVIADGGAVIGCPAQINLMTVPLPIVVDNCGNTLAPTGPPAGPFYDPDPFVCEGTITYTWTYQDCEMNTFEWDYVYTVDQAGPPSEVGGPVPNASTVECYLAATAPSVLPVVHDACGNVIPAPMPVVGGTYETGDCEGTITYTYTYTNCPGLQYVWTYTYTIACFPLKLKVLLQGPYVAGGTMTKHLNTNHLLPGQDKNLAPNPIPFLAPFTPFGQPYNTLPWAHPGGEGDMFGDASSPGAPMGVMPYPADAVDWVLVTVRDGLLPVNDIWTCAGLVLTNGDVIFPGECLTELELDPMVNYYIVIEHRNHLAVMTPLPAAEECGGYHREWDFTSSNSYEPIIRYGQVQVESNIWAMHMANGEQISSLTAINSFDRTLWRSEVSAVTGYLRSDHDMNAFNQALDENHWKTNQGKTTGIIFNY